MVDLDQISTERRNPQTSAIDALPTLEMLRLINEEDSRVAGAVRAILPAIADAVDAIARALAAGGRLIYLGAGTSGRLGVLDAAECPPTYGTDPARIIGLIAGGPDAMFTAKEGAEDSEALGAKDLARIHLTAADVVCGIAASGRTPYVIGALKAAREAGAVTIALTCSKDAPIAALADIPLVCVTGPEVVTGSTRMKAGTAEKLILNMLSTGAMIRLGKVYGNLMVDVKATNEKLTARARRIVSEAADVPAAEAAALLARAGGSAKLAILMGLTGLDETAAGEVLQAAKGHLREALSRKGTNA